MCSEDKNVMKKYESRLTLNIKQGESTNEIKES